MSDLGTGHGDVVSNEDLPLYVQSDPREELGATADLLVGGGHTTLALAAFCYTFVGLVPEYLKSPVTTACTGLAFNVTAIGCFAGAAISQNRLNRQQNTAQGAGVGSDQEDHDF